MDDRENALGDRLNRATAPVALDRPLFPAEARAEAERRLHAAWLSETGRQSVEEIAPAAPSPAPAPAWTVDPRTEILGLKWEAFSDEPRWIPPQVPELPSAHRAAAVNVAPGQEWIRPSELTVAPPQPYETSPAPQYAAAPSPQYAPPAQQYAPPAQQYAAPAPQYAAPAPQYAPPAPQYAPPAPQYVAPAPQYAPPAPQYAPHAPQYAPPAPQYTPQYVAPAPQYAPPPRPQPFAPFAPVAPQREPSLPPSDDSTLRSGVVENLEFARQRVEELRKLQEWRLGQERRVSEEIGRRNALAEAALEEDLLARREAEELRLAQWRAEARAQFERDLAREEAEFERRLADRRRDAEVELEARLLRRIDDAARRAETLEKARIEAQEPEATDTRLYVVRSAG